MTAVTPAALTLTGPPIAAFAPSRNPRMTGPTLTEECRAIQTDYPAWHVWHGDGGWVYATHDWADGTATTLDSHGPQLMGHVIAEFEHHQAFAGLMGGCGMTNITERVILGAEFLDQSDPGWWREDVPRAIDLDTLKLSDACSCVLGQRCPLEILNAHRTVEWSAHPYEAYVAVLAESAGTDSIDEWASTHGFMAREGAIDSPEWATLTHAWSDLITKRRKDAADRGELA